MTRPRSIWALAIATFASMPALAQIIPDGVTTTSVVVEPVNGATNVIIAPPPNTSGISRNTYSSFSVTPAGATLDNRIANARTILNEVTSSLKSDLRGPIEVFGARAHLIIANPNGISVDGAVFKNTGGLVLSTGQPSTVTHQIAPRLTQDNVVLQTRDGLIEVKAGGLSGAITSLQLLAGQLKIDGPVENSSSNVRADIRLIAGGSSIEYDSGILPSSDLEDWGQLTDEGFSSGDNAVEITARGSLKANRIRILATNEGAGVSHAGNGYASLGDFTIDAKGVVSTTGSIKAAKNIRVVAPAIRTASVAGKPQRTIEAIDGALTLLATSGGISNTGVLMSGGHRNTSDTDSLGAVTLNAVTDISLLTDRGDQLAIVFASAGDLVANAGGDIVNNTGRLLSNASTKLNADGDVTNIADILNSIGLWTHETSYGKRLWYTFWQERSSTESVSIDYGDQRVPNEQAYIVGENVSVAARGNIINRAGTINANSGTVQIVGASIVNEGMPNGSLEFTKSCGLICVAFGRSDISILGGSINAAQGIFLTSTGPIGNLNGQIVSYGDVRLSAPDFVFKSTPIPVVASRRPGLYNFWQNSSAWIVTTREGGTLWAPLGTIDIETFEPIRATAGQIAAMGEITIPAGLDTIDIPPNELPFGKKPLGVFRNLIDK